MRSSGGEAGRSVAAEASRSFDSLTPSEPVSREKIWVGIGTEKCEPRCLYEHQSSSASV